MSDLIKRSDAIKVLKDSVVEMGGDDFCEMGVHIDDIEAVVNAIPSADRPSKEGEWEIEEFTSIYGKGYRLTCSECGDVFTATDEALLRERYCRYCGAKNSKRWKGADDVLEGDR